MPGKLIESYGVIGEYDRPDGKGHVTKEVNLVDWGEFGPMLDIRKWQDGEPRRGISIAADELDAFFAALQEAFPDRFWRKDY